MYSILNKISKHEKMNNISTSGLYFNFSEYFPKAFYKTVINYIKRANPQYNDEKPIYDFYIGFDSDKNAYLEFVGRDKKTKVIVIQDNVKYNIDFPPCLIIKENIFLENVINLDSAQNKRILDSLPLDFIKRFLKDKSQIEPIENSFNIIADQIIDYISYLENEFIQSSIETIYFEESEASKSFARSGLATQKHQAPRKNEKIPFEQRKEVLDSYPASETFEAISQNTNSKYYVKVFKMKPNCKLVMEPIEGNKYTKVVHLDTDKISKGVIREIVIDSLQLSRKETTNTKEITRHSHTTLEEYKKLLEYLVNSNNTGLHHGTIKRIDQASNTKTR